VLIQEIFGVNEHIQSVADQYASDGYVVLAPDLFWRSEPGVKLGYDGDDWERAFALMKALDFDLAIDDLGRTAELLRGRDDCNGRVSLVGYCMGGVLSFLRAANAGVDAAVCYSPGSIAKRLDQAANGLLVRRCSTSPKKTTTSTAPPSPPCRKRWRRSVRRRSRPTRASTMDSTAGRGQPTTRTQPPWPMGGAWCSWQTISDRFYARLLTARCDR